MTHAESLANDDLDLFTPERAVPPTLARAVIIGAGIVGSSIAYHLSALGWRDIVVLDRAKIASGTSWHAAGLLAQVRPSHALTKLARYGPELYSSLPDTGCNRVGSLTIARTEERMIELRYVAEMGRHHGIEVNVVDGKEAAALFPLLDPAGVVGGVHAPGDGMTNPGHSAVAIARAAHENGVRFYENTRVTEILQHNGRASGVRLASGDTIEAEVVVLAAGLWSRELGLSAGVPVPLFPAEHMWVQTAPIDGMRDDVPYLRDLDARYYVRHYRGGVVMGAFEPDGKPRPPDTIPDDFCFGEFPADEPHFAEPLGKMRDAMPSLRETELVRFFNGPESFTPDNQMLMGEAPELPGLFVAAGMNSQGIIYAPGVGRALAEWIDNGSPTFDASEVDIARLSRAQNDASYLHARTRESLGLLYGMHWPTLQPQTARDLLRTPLYDRLAARGAHFGTAAGWERANFYGRDVAVEHSYRRPSWHDAVALECRAAREHAALFDLSTFAKFELDAWPDHIEVGRVKYTFLLNARGGIDTDCTVARLADDRYLLVAPTTMRRKVAGLVDGRDVTEEYGTIGIFGPDAFDVVGREAPFATAHLLDDGVIGLRMSYVGERGWELYVPVAQLLDVYDAFADLPHAGFYALDALRLEKGFVSAGHDVGPIDRPGDLRVNVLLRDPDHYLQHGESVLGDGAIVGRITSGAYGHTLGGAVGIALLHPGTPLDGEFAVDIAGTLVAADVSAKPFYDPTGERMRR
jgi:glycine/D-amino acid oxidase-like deaminating enzyme/glycine cleavage system aminomethyltransferase T